MSCTVSTWLELVALSDHQFVLLAIGRRMGIWQLDAGFLKRTFTWRALHCRQPNRLFLWPRRGIEVSSTSEVASKVALPRSGWVTLDAATRWCRCFKANARRGGKAQWVDNLFLHGWHGAIPSLLPIMTDSGSVSDSGCRLETRMHCVLEHHEQADVVHDARS